ncbi:MFS transporter [Isoptericola cucumis]|uniref:MFS transporter n=1 Tax=Isoptericola cucumis TaxID=1776856 RepID=A0ABQ2B4P2_9MICO|nr:MFS transporter [Isoptericola cucumis]GGI07797.1 MFS transporter [Isoptericola cucumis]
MPRSPEPTRTVRDAAAGITVLAVANFVAITTEVLPVGLLPQLARGVDVTESTAGLLVTVYAFVVAAFAVPLTVATRAVPRKPLLLVTLGIYSISNVLVAVAPSYAMLVVARTLGGLGHAVFFSVSIAYAARLVSPLYTGRALTLVTAGGTIGFVLGVPLSTSLGAAVGWRWSFALLGAVCAATALLVARLLPAVAVEPEPPRDRSGARAGRKRLGIVVGTNTVLFGGQYTVYTYISVILLAAGLSEAAVGPALLVFGALGLVGLWAAARYLDRTPRALTLAAMATIAVALVAVALALPATVGVLVAAGVWLAAFGAIPATFQAAALRTQGATADVAGAFVNATSNLGIGLGAAAGAVIVAGPGPGALALAGAAIVAASCVAVLVARRAFPREP